MEPQADGYFSCLAPDAGLGMVYRFRLTHGEFPDPASRFQPEGPHGPSEIVDPGNFQWNDQAWKGVVREGQVIYEMHIGTFTPEGTWTAAAHELEELARLGITVIELMPVADFAGRFGWGYDGVNMFAPTRLYGQPDDFRAFVDRAHTLGIGVILDVVYNHFGPDGNYVGEFTEDYFSKRYKNEWGEALNFDGRNSPSVRAFFIGNAGYWIDEYHLDGLRLDATQQIFDDSADNIMAAITRHVRSAARGRSTYVVAENEPQQTKLVRSAERGGYGMDALWNDDFHHTAWVACTGRREAYYTDYKGTPQEFISAAKWGLLFQGQRFCWHNKRRGTAALDLEPSRFVVFIQNHDQIANSLRGDRIHQTTSPGRCRALTALLLLGPATPMLFQGQEFAASTPFLYFADHHPKLAERVAAGRREFLGQFPSLASPECETILNKPESERTFLRSKLDFRERVVNREVYQMHRDLIRLRRDPAFSTQRRGAVDGAVLGPDAFLLRFFGGAMDHDAQALRLEMQRLLIINLGFDLLYDPAPEPLLAPLEGCQWKLLWSSEDPLYGGSGTPLIEPEKLWRIPAHSAVVFALEPWQEKLKGLDGRIDSEG